MESHQCVSHNGNMRYLFIFFLIFSFSGLLNSQITRERFGGNIKINKSDDRRYLEEAIKEDLDSFYDPSKDYTKFQARVTDRDDDGNIYKLKSDNFNVRFYKAGDELSFRIENNKEDQCTATIRHVEDEYFVVYIKQVYTCWTNGDILRTGTLLQITSPILAKRVKQASIYRLTLIKRRRDFYKQLNETNNFLWTFDQQKVLATADYDRKILEIQKQKDKAIEDLQVKRRDSFLLQRKLIRKLDELDNDLNYFKVDKYNTKVDRWNHDQNLGLPVEKRPSKLKAKSRRKISL